MLVNDRLDKQVYSRAMAIVKPNDLGIKYGLDNNKIKGVNNFPIFSDKRGIHCPAHPSAEEFIYTKSVGNKYSVGKTIHRAPPSVDSLYDFDADGKVAHGTTPQSHLRGIGNSLYGLPDLTINIDNYGAKEAGVVGMTEKEAIRKNWKENPSDGNLPSDFDEIINSDHKQSKGESDSLDAYDEIKGESKEGEFKEGESKEGEFKEGESKEGESKGFTKPRGVVIQPAFGSSTPKQSGEERGSELQSLARVVNDERMKTPKRSKSKTESPDDDQSLQRIIASLSAKGNDGIVGEDQFQEINQLLKAMGKPKIHGNTKSAKTILKKINESLVGESSAKKSFLSLLDSAKKDWTNLI